MTCFTFVIFAVLLDARAVLVDAPDEVGEVVVVVVVFLRAACGLAGGGEVAEHHGNVTLHNIVGLKRAQRVALLNSPKGCAFFASAKRTHP